MKTKYVFAFRNSFQKIWLNFDLKYYVKGTLLGLRQFLKTKNPLKTMKNAFHFTLKYFFVLKIHVLKFLSGLFCHVETAWLEDKVNSKSQRWKQTTLETNNCNTHIVQYLENSFQSDNEIFLVNRIKHDKDFAWKIMETCGGETSPRPFFEKSKLSLSLHQ